MAVTANRREPGVALRRGAEDGDALVPGRATLRSGEDRTVNRASNDTSSACENGANCGGRGKRKRSSAQRQRPKPWRLPTPCNL